MEKFMPMEQILTLLAEGPRRLAEATAGLTEAQLQTPPAPDTWSANGILAHLRSCEDMWGGAIRRIVAEDHPTLKAVNPRTWMEQTDYPELEFFPSLRAFTAQRAQLVALLEGLAPEDWERAATVSVAGKPMERTVQYYADWLARHERSHVRQVERLAVALRK